MSAGEVVYVKLDPTKGNEQAGVRPCLVISENVHPALAIVVPLTTSPPRNPKLHIELGTPDREGRTSTALCEQVRAVDLTLRESARHAPWNVSYDDLNTVRRTVARAIGIY